jgi:hypothetical protein
MAGINREHIETLDQLKNSYSALPSYKKWFYPDALSAALDQYDSLSLDSSFAVCMAFLNDTWFFQRWFSSSFFEFSGSSLISALRAANDAGLLTGEFAQANFNAVAGHQRLRHFALALQELNAVGLLTGESAEANREAVAGHQLPWVVADALKILNTAGLLTGESAEANREAVAGHEDLCEVTDALEVLNVAGLLTGERGQLRFNLVAITHSAILFHEATANLWSRVPGHQLTETRFNAIIDLCNNHQNNPDEARRLLIDYVNRELLEINPPQAGAAPLLNQNQSTHTESIHKSVSQSATSLMSRYKDRIIGSCLDEILAEFSSWLDKEQDSSPKIIAAKRCLRRLIAPNYYFIDPVSQVSTKQLLALVWLAFHDDLTERQGRVEDARGSLIEGLYEIQRGHNLDEVGFDKGGNDLPICDGGTFNKIIEKGWGRHPDMALIFITSHTVALKLLCVVQEEATEYLQSLANPGTKEDFLKFTQLMAQIKKEGAEAIWESIKDKIATRMFDEFGRLYQDNQDPKFIDLINAGKDRGLPDLSVFQEQIQASKGYHQYCSQILRRTGLFSSFKPSADCLAVLSEEAVTRL